MANYNCDEPKERGFWYDVHVTRKVLFDLKVSSLMITDVFSHVLLKLFSFIKATKRSCKELYGKLLLGYIISYYI